MKIKIYIITYNNNKILQEQALDSLLESTFPKNSVEIFIIDNFGDVSLQDNPLNATVLYNQLRSKHSTGHLARNWNQSIILGFENLNNPSCDVVIGVQNDTTFVLDWYDKLTQLLPQYDYITQGSGDQLQVFTPNSIKNIGLYDERFCNIGYQEADYFLRAALYYKERVSINDTLHGRVCNPILQDWELIKPTRNGSSRGESSHIQSAKYHKYSLNVFRQKYNCKPDSWDFEKLKEVKMLCQNYMLYPYFEENINEACLRIQNYNI